MRTRALLSLVLAVAIGLTLARQVSASPAISPLVHQAIDYLKTRGILPLWIGATRPVSSWDLQAVLAGVDRDAGRLGLAVPDLETLQWLSSGAGSTFESITTGPFGTSRTSATFSMSTASSAWALGWAVDSYTAALTAKINGAVLRAGRLTLGWGPAPAGGGLIFGESAGGFDALELSFVWRTIRFAKVVGWLDGGRSIVGTRMDIPYRRNLRLGLSESIVMDGAPYPVYALVPVPIGINPYLSEQFRAPQGFNDNTFLGFDFEWVPRPGLRVFGELLVDDFTIPTPTANFPSRWGLSLGVQTVTASEGSGSEAMYTIVPNWMYSATDPALHYLLRGLPMGHVLGADFDLLHVRRTFSHPPATSLWAAYVRKGEGRVGRIWADEAEARQYTFLRGTVEYSLIAGVDLPYAVDGWTGTIGPWLAHRTNADHVAGATRIDWGVNLALTATF